MRRYSNFKFDGTQKSIFPTIFSLIFLNLFLMTYDLVKKIRICHHFWLYTHSEQCGWFFFSQSFEFVITLNKYWTVKDDISRYKSLFYRVGDYGKLINTLTSKCSIKIMHNYTTHQYFSWRCARHKPSLTCARLCVCNSHDIKTRKSL